MGDCDLLFARGLIVEQALAHAPQPWWRAPKQTIVAHCAGTFATTGKTSMPIFMDRHNLKDVNLADVAEAHRKDLAIQDQYGVRS